MNVYVVVEGNSTEPKVYRSWIPIVNPKLQHVDYLPQVIHNNFIIRSGGGWPYLLKIIEHAIDDIKTHGNIDRLVVSADSEDMSLQARFNQVDQYIRSMAPPCPHRIIIQNFCFEAWALGNRKILPRRPNGTVLQAYKTLHDVTELDPELLPPHPAEELNRAQFADKYLRLAIRDRGKHMTYSKANPQVVAHPSYFEQLQVRLQETAHISSLGAFIEAFS